MEKAVINRIRKIFAGLVVACLSLSISCSHKPTIPDGWDEDTATYGMSSLGLYYTIEEGLDDWIIGNTEELIPQIKFVGYNVSTGICISVVKLDTDCQTVSELDSVACLRLVYDLLCSSPQGEILNFSPTVHQGRNDKGECWDFDALLVAKNNADTIPIVYKGTLFDTNDGISTFFATQTSAENDSAFSSNYEHYYSYLHQDL